MMLHVRSQLSRFFVCYFLLLLSSSQVQGGLLSGHPDAYAGWTGSVPFSNIAGLSGTIDYAVFKAADFNGNFGGTGYTPGAQLVYTYQVNVAQNSLFVSAEIVGIVNPANTIGTFGPLNALDVDASSASFDPSGNAQWFFTPDEIPAGLSSFGLAFSSPNIPMPGASVTIDGGTFATSLGLPTPSSIVIPEPMSLALIASGLAVAITLRRLHR
ncbi:MAG: PEP-CTERM sorting domain-containing protein [Bythopirellula sp.]|nr:PEP-CTERM sorting domain-containing protein [Bythopirellula sp.]